jgi:prophage antirepressor-like protein
MSNGMPITSIMTFPLTGAVVRMVGTAERPEWIAQDVADALGIKNAASTMRSFKDSEKGVHSMHTPGGSQTVLTVTEPGLYRLIFLSRKPEAEKFQSWVFDEVLPAIRRHGCYPAPVRPRLLKGPFGTHPVTLQGADECARVLIEQSQALVTAAHLLRRAYDSHHAWDILCLCNAAQETYSRNICEAARLIYAPPPVPDGIRGPGR